MNYISDLGFSKIKNLSWRMVYFMLVAFLMVNIQVMVPDAIQDVYLNIIIVYVISVLVFAKYLPSKEDNVFNGFGNDILYAIMSYVIIKVLPFGAMAQSSGFDFGSVWFAWLFFLVVGFSETLVYVMALPEKIGIFWSSVIFGIMHLVTNIVLTQSYDVMIISKLMAFQFIANYIFYLIYKQTKSVFVVVVFHALIDLKKVGLL